MHKESHDYAFALAWLLIPGVDSFLDLAENEVKNFSC